MAASLPALIEAMASNAKKTGISVDETFRRSAVDYMKLIETSRRPELISLAPRARNVILAVIGNRAISMAHEARSLVVTAEYFKQAIQEYKGPTIPPWDTCEYAAIQIAKDIQTYEMQLSESLRRSL